MVCQAIWTQPGGSDSWCHSVKEKGEIGFKLFYPTDKIRHAKVKRTEMLPAKSIQMNKNLGRKHAVDWGLWSFNLIPPSRW